MAAHRYWRLKSLDIPGSFLEISEVQFLQAGSNVTGSGTFTSSSAPDVFGATSAIVDGNLSTRCIWNASTAENAAFWLKIDFGAGNDKAITGIKQGGFDTSDRYIRGFTLEWSDDDSAWTAQGSKASRTYPGNNTLSVEYILEDAGVRRLWRVNSISVTGTGLTLTELQLLVGGVNQNSGATVTSSSAPGAGSLPQLVDGNLTTVASWSDVVAEGAGFYIKWDFGAHKAIDGLKQGGSNDSTQHMSAFTLQWSNDDDNWTTYGSKSGLTYPGDNTLSVDYFADVVAAFKSYFIQRSPALGSGVY